MARSIALIGAGRMGGAMARGWLSDPSGSAFDAIFVVEPSPSEAILEAAAGGRLLLNAPPRPVDILVLAVKPQGFAAALPGILPWLDAGSVVISIMAGVTLERISTSLGVSRVVRAMPNTPGAVGRGVTGYAASDALEPRARADVEGLLAPLGEVVGPLEERLMNAVTAVSGSGPAYVFHLAEALAAAGVRAGLPVDVAERLARATIAGSGALLTSGDDPAALRQAVTSPGGTTAAALSVLMGPGGFSDLLDRAVDAAVARGRELASSS